MALFLTLNLVSFLISTSIYSFENEILWYDLYSCILIINF